MLSSVLSEYAQLAPRAKSHGVPSGGGDVGQPRAALWSSVGTRQSPTGIPFRRGTSGSPSLPGLPPRFEPPALPCAGSPALPPHALRSIASDIPIASPSPTRPHFDAPFICSLWSKEHTASIALKPATASESGTDAR